jgi:hypothetical protein
VERGGSAFVASAALRSLSATVKPLSNKEQSQTSHYCNSGKYNEHLILTNITSVFPSLFHYLNTYCACAIQKARLLMVCVI